MDSGNELVARWTRGRGGNRTDIFFKFILLPVNHGNRHWGLFVLINVGKILRSHVYHDPEEKKNLNEDAPLVLYFDSLGAAGSLNYYHSRICSWLDFEAKERKLFPGLTHPFGDKNKNVLFPLYAPKGEKVCRFKQTIAVFIYIISFLNYSLLLVSMQENGDDCGVYVCRYAYSIMCMRETKFTFDTLSRGEDFFCITPRGLTRVITKSEAFCFGQSDITSLRGDIYSLIRKLARLYSNFFGKIGFSSLE